MVYGIGKTGKALAIAIAGLLLFVGTTVPAAKPAPVMEWSNGFPSGPHHNLNIHGKKDGFACDPTPGGGSVFVPEYGQADIEFIQNKRSSLDQLYVHDPCGTFDGDAARVQLPAEEYQVYARILAKPSKAGEERSVVFYPSLVEACDGDPADETFGDATSCDEAFLLPTGKVTKDGVFDMESGEFTRSSGKSKAVDVTGLFTWSGWVCDESFDTNNDGQMTVADLDSDGDGIPDMDLDGDTDVDEDDLAIYLATNCEFFESEWIFNIADLVVYGWDYQNHGSKLLQVRFYPTSTTDFEA